VARRLFKWLYKRGILVANLAADLELPKLPRHLRNGISDDNLLAILDSARNNPRDYAILMFLAITGARRAGVSNLLLEHLNLGAEDARLRRRVTVLEKGDKERIVLLNQEALEALEAWLLVRPEVADRHVFLGQRPGEDWHPLTPSGISQIVERYKQRLGLTGRTSPHQWRHRFCRRKLQQGMDLSQVSQLAGHEDPAITIRFYGGFDIDQLQASFDQHPEL
jgi:integrase/recombinase XerC